MAVLTTFFFAPFSYWLSELVELSETNSMYYFGTMTTAVLPLLQAVRLRLRV